MGLMALGPKRSEAAYTPADLHLLHTVATQTGLAIEVAELAHSLAAEAAQRERVNREIRRLVENREKTDKKLNPEQLKRLTTLKNVLAMLSGMEAKSADELDRYLHLIDQILDGKRPSVRQVDRSAAFRPPSVPPAALRLQT